MTRLTNKYFKTMDIEKIIFNGNDVDFAGYEDQIESAILKEDYITANILTKELEILMALNK